MDQSVMALKKNDKKQRVREQLKKAGVTQYGLLKNESRHLHGIVHDDEKICGVVYGRTDSGSAMIVATDRRIIYLDHRLLFNKSEVLTYEVVSGVTVNEQSGYAGVVLHTRVRDFRLRFVNLKCARKFAKFIEARRILTEQDLVNTEVPTKNPINFNKSNIIQKEYSQTARAFLIANDIAVLSTISANNIVSGSVVYYMVDSNNLIYIATKTKTAKSFNIANNPTVALTIFNTESLQTLQIEGSAFIETDPNITKDVYETVLRPRFKGNTTILSPILHMSAGEYEVIVVKTQRYKFADYK